MLKTFILFLAFESGTGQTALHHIDFSSRQSCEAARVTLQARAKQPRPAADVPSKGEVKQAEAKSADSKPQELLKLIDAVCLEK